MVLHRPSPDAFGGFLHASRFALLRLERTPRIEFHRGVAEFFQSAWPDQLSFGVLPRASVRHPGWFDQVFQSRVGAVRGGVRDGYWLFERGTVLGHHLGVISAVTYQGADLARQRERVVRHAFGGVGPREEVLEAARQIVVYFDELVARRLTTSGEPSASWVREERERATPPPSRPTAPPPAEDDPYVLLGVARDATDDELKSAYKQQMKLNHPDKVAHLSPALQKFAEQQTLALKAAYERILRARHGAG